MLCVQISDILSSDSTAVNILAGEKYIVYLQTGLHRVFEPGSSSSSFIFKSEYSIFNE